MGLSRQEENKASEDKLAEADKNSLCQIIH